MFAVSRPLFSSNRNWNTWSVPRCGTNTKRFVLSVRIACALRAVGITWMRLADPAVRADRIHAHLVRAVGRAEQKAPAAVERDVRKALRERAAADEVFQFLFDETNGRLTANTPPVLQLKQGTGPRHLIVSSDNRFVYLLNELTGTVITLALDPSAGTLKESQLCVCVAPGHQARPRRAARSRRDPWREPDPAKHRQRHLGFGSHITPNGRFLYAAERTSSTLAAFRVDTTSGKLTYLGSTPTEKQPRGFNIDPASRFVIVSGEKSDTISSYAIDAATGALKPIGRYPTGKGANWVEIVAFD